MAYSELERRASSAYRVTLLDFAAEDFDKLDGNVQQQANKQFEKLKTSPELGEDLGNKYGIDLTSYKALHFYKNQYRIIYRILEDKQEVEIWGIGKREREKIYRMVGRRVRA